MNFVVKWSLCLLCCGVALFLSLINLIFVGRKKFFTVKTRETPPPCLLDPNLGRHGYVMLKDIKLHYVMNGDITKPLMVLLHGFPEFWFSWRHQLKEFSKEYCVVAVDMRGFGDSDKPPEIEDYLMPRLVDDIYQLIKHFTGQDGSAYVMAHDWGGLVAFNLASKYPEVVKKLIIGNVPHPNAFQKAIATTWTQLLKSWYIFYFMVPVVAEMILRTNDIGFLNVAFRNGKEKILSKDEMEAFKYIFSRPGAFTQPLNYYRANMTASTGSKTVLRVSVPTLLIWGDNDVALSLYAATTSSQYIDEFHLRIIQGGSHWIQQDRPEEFNNHAWSFLQN